MNQTITKNLIIGPNRTRFLFKKLGKYFLAYEILVYQYMKLFCKDYQGGYWEFYTLSNGGFFMQYAKETSLNILSAGNYFESIMSTEAASLGVNLFALNRLTWEAEDQKIIDYYDQLKDYAMEHVESQLIARWID
ncbi:MAG: antirestriction protein [Pseudomonadota bacterium]